MNKWHCLLAIKLPELLYYSTPSLNNKNIVLLSQRTALPKSWSRSLVVTENIFRQSVRNDSVFLGSIPVLTKWEQREILFIVFHCIHAGIITDSFCPQWWRGTAAVGTEAVILYVKKWDRPDQVSSVVQSWWKCRGLMTERFLWSLSSQPCHITEQPGSH